MSNITDLSYSAGIVSQCFWFVEVNTFLKMEKEYANEKELRQKCLDENIFGLPNEKRSLEVYRKIKSRTDRLDRELKDMFLNSDIKTQKLIDLIAIVRGDRLFFEFINEVYREKAIIGQYELTDMDINVFFTQKSADDEFVSNIADVTKKRMRRTYMNFLTEAGLLTMEGKKHIITKPIMDINLERKLRHDGEEAVAKAIEGVL